MKVAAISFMWFIYYGAGTKITGYYRWTWLSSLIAIYVAWAPVVLAYVLLVTQQPFADTLFFYFSLTSIIGPLVGYFVPLVILILAYNERGDTGLIYSSSVHFWLGWSLAVAITLLSIFFEFAFLPVIRVWYDFKQDPELSVETTDEEEPTALIEDSIEAEDETSGIVIEADEDDSGQEVVSFFAHDSVITV